MNLPGIGDPIELSKRMKARGLIKFPNPAAVATEVAIGELAQLKASPRYLSKRVVDSTAPLGGKSIKQKGK